MIDTIFIDLDDVCNTFTPHILYTFGCDTSATDYAAYPADFGFDLPGAVSFLTNRYYTENDFWNQFSRDMWTSAPESDILRWLVDKCRRLVDEANVFIATAPPPAGLAECLVGKVEWIHAHLPPWLRQQFVITSHKHLLANPSTLLIDDNENNTDRFERFGGNTILVSRPWNSLWEHEPDVKESIKTQLQEHHFKCQGPQPCPTYES